MQSWISPLLLVAVVFLLWPNNSPAPIIYRPGEGWSYESKDSVGKWRRDRAKSQLEVAQEAVTKEDWKIVYKASRRIVHEWPLSAIGLQAERPERSLWSHQGCFEFTYYGRGIVQKDRK